MINELMPELAAAAPGRLQAQPLPSARGPDPHGRGGHARHAGLRKVLGLGGPAEQGRAAELSATLRPEDAINIQFTSGTTGAPKGATLTHHNIVNNANFVTAAMRLGPEDRLCIPVPLYHCFGMVMGTMGCVTKGATMVFPGEGFDPGATLNAVAAGALHRALRGADHVRRHARPSELRRASTSARCAPASWPARPVRSR